MDSENITIRFKFVRHAVIFTDKKMFFFDEQGSTGAKMIVNSVNLEAINSVTVETAGFGIDNSEISVKYITTPNMKSNNIATTTHKMEFLENILFTPYKNVTRVSI